MQETIKKMIQDSVDRAENTKGDGWRAFYN